MVEKTLENYKEQLNDMKRLEKEQLPSRKVYLFFSFDVNKLQEKEKHRKNILNS